mgnify:CR=1 FL=1
MINGIFWKNKRVFITGHTGFKGSWLAVWLQSLGAVVTGYSLDPPTTPSLFELCSLKSLINHNKGDIRDSDRLKKVIETNKPEIIFHMAAQPIVKKSYENPVETYSTNVMGTISLFEAVKSCNTVRAVVNVTTDKVYENNEWVWGYRENEPLGGYDPYSSSKACSELITSSYRNSFFNPIEYENHGVGLASARAGNVIGGGDWANDRLIPDFIRAIINDEPIVIRNPGAVRPWQHVLEPLSGYIVLAQKLYENYGKYADSWNFGPKDDEVKTVQWIVHNMCSKWGENATFIVDDKEHPHEAQYLKLDCSKANRILHWHPRWNINQALDKVIEWTKGYLNHEDLLDICLKQIDEYVKITKEV